MKGYINQCSGKRVGDSRGTKRTLKPILLLLAVSLAFVLLASGSSAHAQQTTLSVSPGWDFTPQVNGKGYVIYSVTGDRCSPKLHVTYILDVDKLDARPTNPSDARITNPSEVWVTFYNLSDEARKYFSTPRFHSGTHTRDGVTSTNTGRALGDFLINPNGHGEAQYELDLTGIPAGTYDVQFGWQTKPVGRVFYRTGTKYGVGFAKIKIP